MAGLLRFVDVFVDGIVDGYGAGTVTGSLTGSFADGLVNGAGRAAGLNRRCARRAFVAMAQTSSPVCLLLDSVAQNAQGPVR